MKRAAIRAVLAQNGLPPGALSVDEAAAYVGLSRHTFLREVDAGNMPKPITTQARRKLFARAALDRILGAGEASATVSADDIDTAIDAYAP